MIFKLGDKVRIKNFSKKHNGKVGVIISIDGFYHYVKLPISDKYPVEVYAHEMELVNDND